MLKKINYSLIALLVLSTRLVLHGAGVGDSIALAALAALYGFTLYLEKTKIVPVNEQVREELEQIRSTVNALKVARSFSKI